MAAKKKTTKTSYKKKSTTKKRTTVKTKAGQKKKNNRQVTYIELFSYSLNDLFAPASKVALVDYGYFKSMVNVPSLKFYFEVLNEFAFGLLLFIGLFLGSMFLGSSVNTSAEYAKTIVNSYAKADSESLVLENVEKKVLGVTSQAPYSCSFEIYGSYYANGSDYSLGGSLDDVYVCAKGLSDEDARWFVVNNQTGESTDVTSATEVGSGDSCAVVRIPMAGDVLSMNAYVLDSPDVTSCYLNFVY